MEERIIPWLHTAVSRSSGRRGSKKAGRRGVLLATKRGSGLDASGEENASDPAQLRSASDPSTIHPHESDKPTDHGIVHTTVPTEVPTKLRTHDPTEHGPTLKRSAHFSERLERQVEFGGVANCYW